MPRPFIDTEELPGFVAGVVAGLLVAAAVGAGLYVGYQGGRDSREAEAVQLGYAHYEGFRGFIWGPALAETEE